MVDAARLARGEIQDHMPGVGSDGRPVRTVDRVGRDFIKPTRAEDAPGGRLRWRPLSTVAGLDGGLVRLSPPAAQAEQSCLTEGEVADRLSPGPDAAAS